jgi:hypothetical protein
MKHSSRARGVLFAVALLMCMTEAVLGALDVPTANRPACRDCAAAAPAGSQRRPSFASRIFRGCGAIAVPRSTSNGLGSLGTAVQSILRDSLGCSMQKQPRSKQQYRQQQQEDNEGVGVSLAAQGGPIASGSSWRGSAAQQYSRGGLQHSSGSTKTHESVRMPCRTLDSPKLPWAVAGYQEKEQQQPQDQALRGHSHLQPALEAAAAYKPYYCNRRMLLQGPPNPRQITLADITGSDVSVVVDINIPIPPKPPHGHPNLPHGDPQGGEHKEHPPPLASDGYNDSNSSIPVELVSGMFQKRACQACVDVATGARYNQC